MPPWHGSMSRTPPEFLLARASTTKGMNGAETVSKDILGEKVQDPWLMLMQSSSTQQLLFTSTLNRPSNYVIKILLTTAFPWAAHYHHPKIVQSLNNRVGSSIRHGSTAAATAQIGAGQSLPSVQSDHSRTLSWLCVTRPKQSCSETHPFISILQWKKSRLRLRDVTCIAHSQQYLFNL